jgi:hypothetical protein
MFLTPSMASAATHTWSNGANCSGNWHIHMWTKAATSDGWTDSSGAPPGQVRHAWTMATGTTWVMAWNQPNARILQWRLTDGYPVQVWTWARARAEVIPEAYDPMICGANSHH